MVGALGAARVYTLWFPMCVWPYGTACPDGRGAGQAVLPVVRGTAVLPVLRGGAVLPILRGGAPLYGQRDLTLEGSGTQLCSTHAQP